VGFHLTSAFLDLVDRVDSWSNAVTGLGQGLYDKRLHSSPTFAPETSRFWEDLWHASSLAYRAVSLPVTQGLRVEPRFTSEDDPETAEALSEADSAMWAGLSLALQLGRCTGGAILVPLSDGDLSEAVQPIGTIERWVVFVGGFAGEITTVERDAWGRPAVYWVSLTQGLEEVTQIAATRAVRVRGAPTSPRVQREYLDGWETSVLQRAYDQIRDYETGWASVWTLLQEASLSVYRMSGLKELMLRSNREAVLARVRAMNLQKSVHRGVVVDKEDTYERSTIQVSGLADVMREGLAPLSMSTGIPQSILAGRSPAGFDATGEADFRAFYDLVMDYQTNEIKPRAIEAAALLARSLGRDLPADLDVDFPPLWTPTAQEEINRLTAMGQALIPLVAAGLLDAATEARPALDGLAGIRLSEDLDAELVAALGEASEAEARAVQTGAETASEGQPGG
jgi:phage-related protein (TIGR01555 family)